MPREDGHFIGRAKVGWSFHWMCQGRMIITWGMPREDAHFLGHA